MSKKSKKTGEKLCKAARQRKQERLQKMTPRERRQLKQERRRMNETKEKKQDRKLKEVTFAMIASIIIVAVLIWWLISLVTWAVAYPR